MRVIETNLSIGNYDEIIDHQSRVIEVESWESYIEEIKCAESVNRSAIMGGMYGLSVPKYSRIENFVSDDIHLSCDIYNYKEDKTKKLAYLVDRK